MDGSAALVLVLMDDPDLTALVPAARIMAGPLPQSTAMPALSVSRISAVTPASLVKGATTFVRERVQVTIHAGEFDQLAAVRKAVVAAAHATFPDVDGIESVTIRHDSGGPDFMNEAASLYFSTEDFRVTYSEAR